MNGELLSGWRVRQMRTGDVIHDFTCGDSDLDDYIINEAKVYQSEMLASNYLIEDGKSRLLAFFTLLNDRVCITDFNTPTAFNRFRRKRFVQAKRFRGYPAVKIGRLAVLDTLRNMGLGSLLLDFIKSYFVKTRRTGCRFLTVDAYRDAVGFYTKNGFVKFNDDSDSNTCLMYYDLIDCKDRF